MRFEGTGNYHKTHKYEISFRRWVQRKLEKKEKGLSDKVKIRKMTGKLGVPDFLIYFNDGTLFNYTFVEVKFRKNKVNNPLQLLSKDQYCFFLDFFWHTCLFFKVEEPKKEVFFYGMDNNSLVEVDPVDKIMFSKNRQAPSQNP